MPDQDLSRALALARRRSFERDEVIFHEADPGDCLHLIERGRVAVRAATRHGRRATLSLLGPGDAFGELALLSGGARRTATVVAIEPTTTLSIYQSDFQRLRAERPEVAEVLVALLSAQVARLTELLLDALFLPAESRVRKRLLEIAGLYQPSNGETVVPLRQEELAELAGTSRSTVNRVLREEVARGSIALERGRTRIIDPDRIRALIW